MSMWLLAPLCLTMCAMHVQAEPAVDLQNSLYTREKDSGKVLLQTAFGPKDRWYAGCHVHTVKPLPNAKEIMKCGTCDFTNEGAVLATDEKVKTYKNEQGSPVHFSNSLSHTIEIPPDAEGKNIKGSFTIRGGGTFKLYLFTYGKKGDKGYKPISPFISANASASNVYSISGMLPKGTESVTFLLQMIGPGKIAVKDAKIVLLTDQTDFDVIETAMGFLDEKFYLPAGTAYPLGFIFRRDMKKTYRNVTLCIQLPQGVRLLGSEDRIPFKDMKDGLCRFEASWALNKVLSDKFYCWFVLQVFVISDRAAESAPVPLRYWLEADGRKSAPRKLDICTAEPVTAVTPKKFFSFLTPVYFSGKYTQTVADAMAALLVKTGFNGITVVNSKAFDSALVKNHIKRTNHIGEIRDGYVKGKSPVFEDIYGKQFKLLLCPEEVINRGPGYLNGPYQTLKKHFEKTNFDYYFVNWEVYHYDYKGCFCKRCMDEFIRFSGLSRKDVEAAWPRQVIAKWHDIWCRFRSSQHGRVCRVLEEDIHALGKAAGRDDVHFMPQVSYACFNESFGHQYHPRDYFKYLKWINLWGPYTCLAGLYVPYTYIPGIHLKHYFYTLELMRKTREIAPQLKVTGFPYGSHANDVNSAEGIAMETLSCFVNGYDGSGIYWFDFDYRYWRLMAKANTMIAAYENIVGVWDKTDKFSVKPVTETLTTNYWLPYYTDYSSYPGLKTAPNCVISKAWKNGNSTLVAAGNFWEKGEVFISLAVPGLRGKYVLRQPHSGKYMRTTAEELQKGVLLHLDTLSWDFFLIEPDNGKYAGKEFTQGMVRGELKEKQPLIDQLMKKETRRYAEIAALTVFLRWNFAGKPEIVAEKVTLSEAPGSKNSQILDIKTPYYTAKLHPEQGGALISFVRGDKELIAVDKGSMTGRAAFVKPFVRTMDSPMRIVDLQSVKNCVVATLERPSWEGLKVRLIWEFYENSVRETAEIQNIGTKTHRLIFRFHDMFSFLGGTGGKKHDLTMGGTAFQTEPVTRLVIVDNLPELPELQIKTIYKQALRCPAGPVDFGSLKFESPDFVYGYFLWNTPAARSGTFEPLFKETELAPGETKRFVQILK